MTKTQTIKFLILGFSGLKGFNQRIWWLITLLPAVDLPEIAGNRA